MKSLLVASAAAVLCVGLCVSLPAFAQAVDPVASAREHYRKGTQLYDLQRFDDAAREYEAAYQAKEDPALLFNIGQSYRFAKKYENAAGAFRSYLRRLPTAPNRTQVEVVLTEVTRLADEQKRLADEQARLADEQKRIADEQKRIADEQVRLRELAEAEAKLREVRSAAPVHTADPAAAARGRKLKFVGIGVAAVGGVALISGVGLLGGAGAISSRYNNLKAPMAYSPNDEARFKTFRTTGAVLAGIGGVAAVAGAVVAVLGSRREHENRVVFAPSVAPGFAGALVSGAW